MYVHSHMQKDPVTIRPETTVQKAQSLLRSNHFRHLPVTDDSQVLLGMVTDRDIRSAVPSILRGEEEKESIQKDILSAPVKEIMSTCVVSLGIYSTLDDALLLLDRERVGALPVVDEQTKVIGIFSVRDLLRAYNLLFGVGEKGSSLVVVHSDGQPRPLSRIVHLLEEHDVHFSRVVRSRQEEGQEGLIYLRVHTFNMHAVHKILQTAGFSIE